MVDFGSRPPPAPPSSLIASTLSLLVHSAKEHVLTVDTGFWGDLALRTWVNVNPSPQWATRLIEPYRGLPFGTYLHSSRPARQRSLTGPINPSGDASLWHRMQVYSSLEPEQHTHDQAQCGLLAKLPLDIRLIIYEMVLGGMVLHLAAVNQNSRIVHHVCQSPHQLDARGTHICSATAAVAAAVTASPLPSPLPRPSAASPRELSAHATGLLPLLVTCRRVYSEAIGTLYSSNTFEFTQNFAAFTFLRRMLPPPRLPQLRHFRLHLRIPRHPALNARAIRDWADLWRFFADELPGLQHLYLELQMLQPVEGLIEATPDARADAWVRPMVLMALAAAARRRACRVEVVTRRVCHEPARVFADVAAANPAAPPESVLALACTELHRRIRVSLGKRG